MIGERIVAEGKLAGGKRWRVTRDTNNRYRSYREVMAYIDGSLRAWLQFGFPRPLLEDAITVALTEVTL